MSSTNTQEIPAYDSVDVVKKSSVCTPNTEHSMLDQHTDRDGGKMTLPIEIQSAKVRKHSWSEYTYMEENYHLSQRRQRTPVWPPPPPSKSCPEFFEAWHELEYEYLSAYDADEEDEISGLRDNRDYADPDSDDESFGFCGEEMDIATSISTAGSGTSDDEPRSVWHTGSKANVKLLRGRLASSEPRQAQWPGRNPSHEKSEDDSDVQDDAILTEETATTRTTTAISTTSMRMTTTKMSTATTTTSDHGLERHNNLRTGVFKKQARVDCTAKLDYFRQLLFKLNPSLRESIHLAREELPLRVVEPAWNSELVTIYE